MHRRLAGLSSALAFPLDLGARPLCRRLRGRGCANCQSLPQAELFISQRERPELHSQAVASPVKIPKGTSPNEEPAHLAPFPSPNSDHSSSTAHYRWSQFPHHLLFSVGVDTCLLAQGLHSFVAFRGHSGTDTLGSLEGNTKGPGTTSSEPLLPS